MRVLVVEDSPAQVSYLQDILCQEGHEVVTARDGKEGLVRRQLWKPDLIVLDLVLPGMGGEQFLEALRLLSAQMGERRVPVVVQTAADHLAVQGLLDRGRDLFPFAVLQKPYAAEQLFETMELLCPTGGG